MAEEEEEKKEPVTPIQQQIDTHQRKQKSGRSGHKQGVVASGPAQAIVNRREQRNQPNPNEVTGFLQGMALDKNLSKLQ